MSYEDFDASWGAHAEEERESFDATPVRELLEQVKSGELGAYYQIWPSIAERATLRDAGSVLYAFLGSGAEYLHRYHCAAALLELLGLKDLEAADLTVPHRRPEENLARVRDELRSRLGAAFE